MICELTLRDGRVVYDLNGLAAGRLGQANAEVTRIRAAAVPKDLSLNCFCGLPNRLALAPSRLTSSLSHASLRATRSTSRTIPPDITAPGRVSFVMKGERSTDDERVASAGTDGLTAGWRQSPPVFDLLGEETTVPRLTTLKAMKKVLMQGVFVAALTALIGFQATGVPPRDSGCGRL